MSTSAQRQAPMTGSQETRYLTTWCRGCGSRILVALGGRRPDFCRLTCRIRHLWRTSAWRSH